MPIYYNANTRPNVAVTHLTGVQEISASSHFYVLYRKMAYPSRAAVLDANITGPVSWTEGVKLYTAHSCAGSEYIPLTQEPSIVAGINWSDAYFFSKEAAQAWANSCGCRHDEVVYHEECDVYSVHYHHFDKIGQTGVRSMDLSTKG